MKRRAALALIGAALAHPVWAQPARLTADEIDALLRGKRIEGLWNGSPYSQVFWENGGTLYMPEGGAPDTGKWRVSQEENTYQSWWENSGWSSYAIERGNGVYYWIDSRGRRNPFEVTGDE